MKTTEAMEARRMDPRIHARRTEVRRALSRKRFRMLMLGIGAFVVLGVIYLAVESPMLDVDAVHVIGNEQLGDEAVIEMAQVQIGEPMMWVNASTVERRVAQLPWVQAVRVQRDLPGTIRIIVTEHEAVAFARRSDTKVALLSNEGRVVADVASPPPGTIEIRGVRKAPAIGRLLSPPEAAGVVRTLPAQLANQVVAIDIAGVGVALELTRGGEVRLGTLDDIDAKSAAALAVLKEWGDAPLSYIDVSVPQSPSAR